MDTKLSKLFTKPLNLLIFAIICTVLWGSAFPAIKIGYHLFQLNDTDISGKIIFAGIRFFLAGIFALIIYKTFLKHFFLEKKETLQNTKKITIKTIFLIITLSFFLTYFQYICFYVGLSNITGVKGSIINSFSSFFTIILASICFKNDRLNSKKIIGIIFGLIGILLTNLNDLNTFNLSFSLKGDGLMLIASISFAIGSVISKKFANIINPIVLTGAQLTIGGFFLMLTGFLMNGSLKHITFSGCMLLLYMALLSAIAFSLWTILLKYNPASKVSIYNFLNPIFGVILSGIFLKENLSLNIIFALIMVCIGIYSINIPQRK